MAEQESDWVQPGMAVARVTDSRGARRVHPTRIERLTKTLVITEDGERFPRSHLSIRRGGTWGWTERLMSADDPFVTKMRAEICQANEVSRARMLCDDFGRQKAGVTAADVILALAPLTGVADEIAALFATTRTPEPTATSEEVTA